MSIELGAIDRLVAWVLNDTNVPLALLCQVLEARGYTYLSSHSTLDEIAFALYGFLHERDPFDAALQIFSSDLFLRWVQSKPHGTAAEIVANLFHELGVPTFPPIRLNAQGTREFGIASVVTFVEQSQGVVDAYIREKDFNSVVGVLKDAWSKLENLLKLTLIFYGRMFPECHFYLNEKDRKKNQDAFDVKGRALESCLLCIRGIEAKFVDEPDYKTRCLQRCHRETPFRGMSVERISESRHFRNYLAHSDTAIVIESKLRSEKRDSFISDTLDPVKRAVGEIYDANLVPWSMLLVSRGVDSYDRAMYGFMDEWVLFNEDQFRNKVAPTRWFYTNPSTSYRLFDTFYFVNPPSEWRIDSGFWEPVLIPRDEVIDEFEKSTGLIVPKA